MGSSREAGEQNRGTPRGGQSKAAGGEPGAGSGTQKQKETESNRLKKRDRRENRGITHITHGSPKTTEWTEKEKFEGRLGGPSVTQLPS